MAAATPNKPHPKPSKRPTKNKKSTVPAAPRRSKSAAAISSGPTGHGKRQELRPGSIVHLTIRCAETAPSLRTPEFFECIKRAFEQVVFAGRIIGSRRAGFRAVHFAVLDDQLQVLAEVDSKKSLTAGMHSLNLGISRGINAASVRAKGGSLNPRHGAMSKRPGWLGPIFGNRYAVTELKTDADMSAALKQLQTAAFGLYGDGDAVPTKTRGGAATADKYSSFALAKSPLEDGNEERGDRITHYTRLPKNPALAALVKKQHMFIPGEESWDFPTRPFTPIKAGARRKPRPVGRA